MSLVVTERVVYKKIHLCLVFLSVFAIIMIRFEIAFHESESLSKILPQLPVRQSALSSFWQKKTADMIDMKRF